MAVVTGTSGNDNIDNTFGDTPPSDAADQISGLGGNDTINGYGGGDDIDGGAGADVVRGGLGSDSIAGNDGNDELYGDDGANDVAGGNDTLAGGAGNDTLAGAAGADVLIGGSGLDVVSGGAGNDTISVQPSDIVAGESYDGGGGNADLLNIVSLSPTETARLDRLAVLSGVEQITSNAKVMAKASQITGLDMLVVTGSVTLTTGGTVDLQGKIVSVQNFQTSAAGNALLLRNTNTAHTVIGREGVDFVEGGRQGDLLLGADGDDTLSGFEGNDTLTGGAGSDSLSGGDGIDTAAFAGRFDEYVVTRNGGKYLVEDVDTGAIDTLEGVEHLKFQDGDLVDPAWAARLGQTFSAENLFKIPPLFSSGNAAPQSEAAPLTAGLSIANVAYAGAFTASQLLNAGFDFGSPGGQALKIGKGVLLTTGDGTPPLSNTRADYSTTNNTPGDASLDAAAAAAGKANTFDASVLTFTLNVTDPSIQFITFDIVMGSEEAGTASDGDIAGVFVNGVNYALLGNDPAKTLSLNQSFQPKVINNAGSPMPIEYTGVSRVLTVSAPVHAGANTIKIAIGDTGDSTFDSGLFVSNLQGYRAGGAGLFVALPGTASSNTLTGSVLGDSITALGGNDTVNGGDGDDIVRGGDGNDRLTGGTGADTLIGGAGDDVYFDLGADTIAEQAGAAGGLHDLVQSAVTFSLAAYANVEDLTLTGAAAINGIGNALNNRISGNDANNRLNGGGGVDSLTGGSGVDTLLGAAGNDVLIGGKGNDEMDGGAGADTFRFAVSNTGNDVILGFATAEDRFDLAGGAFSGFTEANGHTRLVHAGGQIVVKNVTGLTLAQWNALVLPAGGTAAEGAHAPSESTAFPFDTHALLARLQHEIIHIGHGEWVFA